MLVKKISFRKIEKLETASGTWYNGLYRLGPLNVEFPLPYFEERAIVESMEIELTRDGGTTSTKKFSAMQITIDGRSWLVQIGGKIEKTESLEEQA